MPLVITTCTNRKRRPVSLSLQMSALPPASLADLATEWASRLKKESGRSPAEEIYGGRGFQEAVAAAQGLDARLMVVSAGLGLIYASTRVPPYACTILVDAGDSVATRVEGDFTAAGWWNALSSASPYSVALHEAAAASSGLIFVALSAAYLDMITGDLLALPEAILSRLRLLTRAPVSRVAPGLRLYLMPYDDRLDGPDSTIPGTRSDFAGRALRHFATDIVAAGDIRTPAEHAQAVIAAIQNWRMPTAVKRIRHDDAAILDLIRAHWDDARGCSLPRMRHEFNVACEQGRYRALSGIVRSERT
jgi:hypothetical protein